MRFKIKKGSDRPKHTEMISCLGWSNINADSSSELITIGDDNNIWKWDINGEPVSIHFYQTRLVQIQNLNIANFYI